MTLEQTTQRILNAAQAQDLEALESASKDRGSLIAVLDRIPATPALRDAVAESIAAGDIAKRTIRAIRQRLMRIERGFLRASPSAAAHRIDYRG